jgi:hypothetical protein
LFKLNISDIKLSIKFKITDNTLKKTTLTLEEKVSVIKEHEKDSKTYSQRKLALNTV